MNHSDNKEAVETAGDFLFDSVVSLSENKIVKTIKLLFLSFVGIIVLSACAQHKQSDTSSHVVTTAEDVSITELFSLINERLSYMQAVAVNKWEAGTSIFDTKQEAIVLKNSLEQAKAMQLNPETIANFFQMQMDVAKDIQYNWHAQWAARIGIIKMDEVMDLNSEIRPALLRLGNAIIAKIYEAVPYLSREEAFIKYYPTFYQSITVEYVTPQRKKQLFEALLKVRRLQ